jgi:hypothetical protein
LFIVAVTYQLLYEQAFRVCVTGYLLAFHMLLKTKYGLRFHMPSSAEVVYDGFVQLADPAATGAVDAGLPDGEGLADDAVPPGDAALRDGAALPDGAW